MMWNNFYKSTIPVTNPGYTKLEKEKVILKIWDIF